MPKPISLSEVFILVMPLSVHQAARKTVKHQFENRYKLADKANSASFQEACAGKGYEGTYTLESTRYSFG